MALLKYQQEAEDGSKAENFIHREFNKKSTTGHLKNVTEHPPILVLSLIEHLNLQV